HAAAALKMAVASQPLIRCTDGELHEAIRIYHPDHSAVIKEILGDGAVFPDSSVYRNKSQWFDFFRALGMSEKIRSEDILRYLDDMIDKSDDLTEDQLRTSARIILDHLSARWDRDLAESRVEDTKTRQTMLFKDALQLRAWIPAQRQETRLARYVA